MAEQADPETARKLLAPFQDAGPSKQGAMILGNKTAPLSAAGARHPSTLERLGSLKAQVPKSVVQCCYVLFSGRPSSYKLASGGATVFAQFLETSRGIQGGDDFCSIAGNVSGGWVGK